MIQIGGGQVIGRKIQTTDRRLRTGYRYRADTGYRYRGYKIYKQEDTGYTIHVQERGYGRINIEWYTGYRIQV